MEDKKIKIEEVEEYIDFLAETVKSGHFGNVPKKEDIDKPTYKVNKTKIEFQYFLYSGDKHYYAARLLFLCGVCEYAFFSAQQCVELYLKGYLKYKDVIFPDSHNLIELINECKKVDKPDDFILSAQIMTVAEKFNSFYEYPRYPVQNVRPNKGAYSFMFPEDIKILDYFIYKMREIIPYPKNMYDVLKEGKLNNTTYNKDGIYSDGLFKKDNINF